ncbi:sigma-70 family RNA polymerase sigma factor [Gandjariella thermophila]|uniref:RNA polymerase sigma-70 region 2 domain-containing protein n=1 Tax=Gandjariella thermophila TaxID=1931992 RepID=A0A4D4J808_9PSEU|nr:sigma-70 family RNA polymerase sigma factor [Gandjariella thermophila]GDY31160.1 hypothetical protein GTS_27930 [Gandjariella thermophila]
MSEDARSGNAHEPESPEDEQRLLDRLRSGDEAAFAELFSRHADAVRRFAARHAADPTDADDLAAEAFFRVLQAVRRGAGPSENVRTYLLTVARRVAWEWSGRRRDVPVTDEELGQRVEPHADNLTRRADHHLIAQAFTSLPERWRTVLWRIEVEGERPATAAPHFGLSANATAALARRARDGLRAAYLQAHVAAGRGEADCRPVLDRLGAYTAGGVKGLEARRIRGHLASCRSCRSLQDELRQVCAELRGYAAVLAPAATVAAFAAGHHLGGTAATAVAPPAGGTVMPATVAGTSGGGTAGPAAAGAAGASGGGAGTLLGKGALLGTRVKLALTAASVAAVGIFGVTAGPLIADGFGRQGVHADGDATPNCLPVAPDPAGPTTEPPTGQPAPASPPGPAAAPPAPAAVAKITRLPQLPESRGVAPVAGGAGTRAGPPPTGAGPGADPPVTTTPPASGSTAPTGRSDPGQPDPTRSSTGRPSPSTPPGSSAAPPSSPRPAWDRDDHRPREPGRMHRPWKRGV